MRSKIDWADWSDWLLNVLIFAGIIIALLVLFSGTRLSCDIRISNATTKDGAP